MDYSLISLKKMEIKDREKFISLYELYKELLTEKKRVYFEEYYLYDCSLQEIALNHDVSRNACFDAISKTCDSLEEYESKLHLLSKQEKLVEILNLDDIEEIKKTINSIIEE